MKTYLTTLANTLTQRMTEWSNALAAASIYP